MAENSRIQWTTHTFNPWMGCTKVSPGCANCYAEELMDHRYGKTQWGPRGPRVIKADNGWREPARWNKLAAAAGETHNVFCASLADVGEGEDTMPASEWPKVQAARARLVETFMPLTNLNLLLLTKRPENLPNVFPSDFLARCWVGTSVEDQAAYDKRRWALQDCPAAVRFYSGEPLLGPIDLGDDFWETGRRVDWFIAGCESLNKRAGRFADGYADAARSLRDQCRRADVAFFHKQMPIAGRVSGEMDEWPEDLRVREMPTPLPA